MRSILIAVAAFALTGCLRKTEYQCSGATSCGAGGVCETTGYCSFPDPKCDSGRSYGESAGGHAGECTEGGSQPPNDADPTMPDTSQGMPDAPDSDAPAAVCPAGYATIAGGNAGHMYKVITTTNDWASQEAACQATTVKSHLAVPDDATELMALDTLIGSTFIYWVGVADPNHDGVWTNVLGANQTYLPWIPPAPDNLNPGEYCVTAIASMHGFNDSKCNSNSPAICECAP